MSEYKLKLIDVIEIRIMIVVVAIFSLFCKCNVLIIAALLLKLI